MPQAHSLRGADQIPHRIKEKVEMADRLTSDDQGELDRCPLYGFSWENWDPEGEGERRLLVAAQGRGVRCQVLVKDHPTWAIRAAATAAVLGKAAGRSAERGRKQLPDCEKGMGREPGSLMFKRKMDLNKRGAHANSTEQIAVIFGGVQVHE